MGLFADFRVAMVSPREQYLVVRNFVGSEAIGCLQYKSFPPKVSQTETDKMK